MTDRLREQPQAPPTGEEAAQGLHSLRSLDNIAIAEELEKAAELFELRTEVTPLLLRAYQQAAFQVQGSDRSVADLFRKEGAAGLRKMEAVTPRIASGIEDFLRTGHMSSLDRLAEELGPEAAFQTLPGIGPALAQRIRKTLNITTLDELKAAAVSGELAQVPGIGPGKLKGILHELQASAPERPEPTGGPGTTSMNNREIADRLFKVASLLNLREQSNPFRVQAYRRAAASLRALERPATDILQAEGMKGLEKIPNVGPGIAARIDELVTTGRLAVIDQLVEELGPEALFQTVPGIGPALANRIRRALGIDTLEELRESAESGGLTQVPGIGPAKARQIRKGLEATRAQAGTGPSLPSIEELLSVDEEYRRKADAGELVTIAPKRYNPTGEKWLPILNTRRGERRYIAVYSNTPRAHEAGKTHDWVVLYWREGEAKEEDQATVVTETEGDLKGLRVVRGREDECREYYRAGRIKQAA